MKCPACGQDNGIGDAFCTGCGYHLLAGSVDHGLASGTSLKSGRYLIEQKLGEGGMGAVYLARMRATGQSCAIKELRNGFSDPGERQEAIQNFQRETEILSKLYHVSIPEFYDSFTEGSRHYFVMEYVEGYDLEKGLTIRGANGTILKPGKPMAWQKAVKYAIQICDVLLYLHSHRPDPIIYRDLKPANVLVTQDGQRLVLTDFGIARFFSPHSRGTAIGTPGYIPPEQYTGMVEPRSDLYALAATLHHLLTDQGPDMFAPFKLPRVRSINSQVPIWLDELVAINLRENPLERYDSAEQLRSDLTDQRVSKTSVCSRCHFRNPPASAYCDRCAFPLSQVTIPCRTCRTANVINSIFCINCGNRL